MPPSELIRDAALWAAACRAHESRRDDRVLDDPFAAHLANDRGEELFAADADGPAAFVLALDDAVIDDVLQRAVVDHHIHTVAALGAGLDTRPYRLELPSDLHWIDVDVEPVLGYKVLRLAHAAPFCHVRRIDVDLSDAAGRRAALRDIATDVTRGLVLSEGLASLGRAPLEELIAHMPPAFKFWIIDTAAARPPQLAAANGAEPPLQPEELLAAFELRGWLAADFRPLKDQALRLGEARAAGLRTARLPGDLEGVWLFQRVV